MQLFRIHNVAPQKSQNLLKKIRSKQILMEKLVDNDTYSDFDGKIGR